MQKGKTTMEKKRFLSFTGTWAHLTICCVPPKCWQDISWNSKLAFIFVLIFWREIEFLIILQISDQRKKWFNMAVLDDNSGYLEFGWIQNLSVVARHRLGQPPDSQNGKDSLVFHILSLAHYNRHDQALKREVLLEREDLKMSSVQCQTSLSFLFLLFVC